MTIQKERAALRVAEGVCTEDQIAAEIHITSRTLRRWKLEPDFIAELERQQKERRRRLESWRERIVDLDIADRSKRLARLDADMKALDQLRLERADDPNLSRLPGGKTGLVLIRRVQTIKVKTTNAKGQEVLRDQTLIEHETDTGLLAESRALAEQAARELGERSEKHEIDAHVDTRITSRDVTRESLQKLTAEELATYEALLVKVMEDEKE